MPATTTAKGEAAFNPYAPPPGVTLDSVLATDELARRPSRSPDYLLENRALLGLAQHLADSPQTILQKLVDTSLEVFRAGSTGVSLISKETGDFYWPAIAGAWQPHIGGGTPRNFGPCGIVLERDAVQLFARPEQYYPYLVPASPIIHEVLLSPFYVRGKAAGTVWVVSHEANHKFDREDARLLASLGTFAAAAFQNVELLDQLQRDREAIRESETRFRSLADAAPAMLWITELDGSCTFLSRGWHEYTGVAASETQGFRWLHSTHPEDHERVATVFYEANRSEEAFALDYRLRRADGEYRWVIDTGRPRLGEAGEFLGFIGSVFDVHERKLAEQALRESMQSLQRTHAEIEAVYEQSPVGLAQFDANLRYVRLNAALAAMNGIPMADHIGKTIHEMVPDLAPKLESEFRRVMETGEPIEEIELKGQTAADPGVEHTWLESWFPLRDETGAVIGLNVSAQDITARKIAEDRLGLLADTVARLLQARDPNQIVRDLFVKVAAHLDVDTYFNFMVNESGDALQLHSCAGIPDETARSIERLEFGQAICGRVAQLRQPIYATDIQNSGYEPAALVRSFGIKAYACNPLIVGDRLLGTLSFASRTHISFNEDALQFMRIIAQHTAIALDRLQSEAVLDRARQDAEAANRAKDRFLAVLSHELRTPLTPVLMTVAALDMDPNLAPELREGIAMIRRNVELEARLIDDLLDLSRITAGKLRLNVEPVDVNAAIQHVSETCRPFILEKAIQFHCELPERSPFVQADPARLQQVLWNLLRNAAKFTREHGEIYIKVTPDAQDRVLIEVRDTGKGIAPDVLPRIFNAFEQGDAAVTGQFGGMGLGLAISKALTEAHGGTIHAGSPGADLGATFTVELPLLKRQESAPSISPRVDRTLAGAALRLLLVEDHADTGAVLARLLRARGFEVEITRSAAAALEVAGRESFDVLVSDIGLPDATGYELMRKIKERYATKGIAMSGYGMDEDQRKSREAGFEDHIIKPVDISQLERAIRRVAGLT